MKKILLNLFLILNFVVLMNLCVNSAEIIDARVENCEVMVGTNSNPTRKDEFFKFFMTLSEGSKDVYLNDEKSNTRLKIVSNNYPVSSNNYFTESIMLIRSNSEDRTYYLSVTDKDGNETKYDKEFFIKSHDWTGETNIISVDIDSKIKMKSNGDNNHDNWERLEFTICTTLNTYDIAMNIKGEEPNDKILAHFNERGNYYIKDGLKYWNVYFVTVGAGERTFSFKAVDKNGNIKGDKKNISFYVCETEEEFYSKSAAGKNPGSDEGKTQGNNKGATGNEDGVDYGSTGKSEEILQNNNKDTNKEISGSGKNDGTGEGSCCKKEDFVTIKTPLKSSTVLIIKPNMDKINALDMVEKNLATVEEKNNEKIWNIWLDGEYEENELKVEVYDENYNKTSDYTFDETKEFSQSQTKIFEEAIKNEIRIEENPNQIKIILQIDNPYMEINGEKYEVDPGRGTKPLLKEGRTLLPIRAIVEKLGGKIYWDEKERKVTIDIFNKTIEMWIGKDKIKNNKIEEYIDECPQIINDRTMIPIRFVIQCLDHTEIEWYSKTKTVEIIYNY